MGARNVLGTVKGWQGSVTGVVVLNKYTVATTQFPWRYLIEQKAEVRRRRSGGHQEITCAATARTRQQCNTPGPPLVTPHTCCRMSRLSRLLAAACPELLLPLQDDDVGAEGDDEDDVTGWLLAELTNHRQAPTARCRSLLRRDCRQVCGGVA
jgi:hypothetical protein